MATTIQTDLITQAARLIENWRGRVECVVFDEETERIVLLDDEGNLVDEEDYE